MQLHGEAVQVGDIMENVESSASAAEPTNGRLHTVVMHVMVDGQ